MGEVMLCRHCGSGDLQAELDRKFCLNCGGHTHFDGTPIPRPVPNRPFSETRDK